MGSPAFELSLRTEPYSSGVHGQDDLVAKPVGNKVHDQGHAEGYDHAAPPADCAAHEHEQHGHEGQKNHCFKGIHTAFLTSWIEITVF
jgi:hypothetical protein